MRAIFHIAVKDLLLRWRDRLGFFWWMIAFPLLIAGFIGALFGGVLEGPSQPMKVVLVQDDQSLEARDFAALLDRAAGITLTRLAEDEAREAVRLGRQTAFVVLRGPFQLSPAIFFGKKLPVAVGIDPAHQAEMAFLQAVLNEAAIDYLRQRWTSPGQRQSLIEAWMRDMGHAEPLGRLERSAIEGALATVDRYFAPTSAPAESAAVSAGMSNIDVIPVDAAQVRPKTSFEICFPLGMIWGLLGLAAEFAMAIVVEREAGTLLRLRVAPISRFQILAGNGLASFIACMGVMVLLVVVGRAVFGIRIHNAAAMTMAMVCTALCFVGITMLLSVMGKTEAAVGGASWAFLLVMAMLGGAMVPTIFMPSWMESIGMLSPARWAILSLEGGIWRDFSVREMCLPCAVLLGQGAVFAILGAAILVRSER